MFSQVYNNQKFCKLFVPLSEIKYENGPTHIVKGSRDDLPIDLLIR